MGEEEAGDSYHDDRDPWSSSLPVVVCKGKRSKRQRVHAAPPPPAVAVVIVAASAEAESSSADAGWRSGAEEEEEDMALCLILLARGGRGRSSFVAPDAASAESTAKKEGRFRSRRPADGGGAGEFVYECRTCGRCFPSFQALGGHRTSHKKPRLLLLSDEKKRQPAVDEERRTPSLSPSPPSPAPRASADPTVLAIPAVPATPPKHETSTEIDVSRRQQQRQHGRVHECSICGSEFASGQALGGHMRRHRPLVVPGSASSSDDLAASKIKEKSVLELDLNMPAPCDEDAAETTSPVAPTHVGAGGLPLLASKAIRQRTVIN